MHAQGTSLPGFRVARLLFLLLLPGPSHLGAQETALVEGVVLDAQSGEAIAGVEIRIAGGSLLTVSDDEGVFRLAEVPRGSQRLVFRHIAYGEHERTIVLEEGGTLQYEVRMSREAIELSPIVVDVARAYEEEVFLRGGNPANIIDARTIDAASRTGLSLMSLLRQQVPGITFRNGNCIEYRMRGTNVYRPDPLLDWVLEEENCREMAVYMDGIRMQESPGLLLSTGLINLERVEVLSPGQAGVQYGDAAGRGVILLTTKTGLAPEFNPDRVNVTGFGWTDPQPYRWPKVFGISLATQALSAAMTFGLLMDCDVVETNYEPATSCTARFATGAGVLSGTVGGLLASWAGKGLVTQGRIFPLMLVGTASATTGYLLATHPATGESDSRRAVGLAIATVGTALMTTLTDRVFRATR